MVNRSCVYENKETGQCRDYLEWDDCPLKKGKRYCPGKSEDKNKEFKTTNPAERRFPETEYPAVEFNEGLHKC